MITLLFAALSLFPTADDRAIHDAPLHAVRFVDRNEGWAAGADGVLWHSIDGGATWERQALPTKGTIHALQFLTPYTGYAAGREEVQATGESAGVLLVTKDGGLTWTRLGTRTLHGLNSVVFSDDKNGFVASANGGPYETNDGGLSWRTMEPLDSGKNPLQAFRGHLIDPGRCSFSEARRDPQRFPFSCCPILDISEYNNLPILVGQCGIIKVGLGWPMDFVDVGLPLSLRVACDFRGVCCRGDHVWIVGSPGTFVLHSGDRGKSWESKPTGQNSPLNAVVFWDDRTGWAVGELGTILATTDGGATWKAQKRGGQRAAIMCIQAQDKNLPLDLIATLGAADGYLSNYLAVTSDDATTERDHRVAAATRKSGGASSDRFRGFPPPERETMDRNQLLADWASPNGIPAMDVLVRKLVMQLRTWQPEVVICDFAGGPAETLVVEAVQAAVKRAADPAAFPEQLQIGRLSPWQVKKLFSLWDGPGAPHINVNTSEVNVVLGESPRDYANRVVGLIAERASLPKQRGLRLLANYMPNGVGLNGIMDGIILAPGGTARRPAADQVRDVKDPNEQHRRELQNLANLAQSGLPQVGDPTEVLARVGQTLDKLPAEQGMNSILAMAQRYAQAGNWPLAKETYELAVARYATQPAGLEAMRWLVRYHSSSEARRRSELKQFSSAVKTEFASAFGKSESITIDGGLKRVADGATENTKSSLSDSTRARHWYQSALLLEPKLVSHGALATGDPSMQFPMAAAKRQLGDADAGKSFFRNLLAKQEGHLGNNLWRLAARQELWLSDRVGEPPRFAATCRKTAKRPHLDASFEDECWTELPGISAEPIAGKLDGYSTTARFAYDDDYLYIALECQHPEAGFRPKVEHRSRDADLAPYDRIEIWLDMDRDYATSYRFCIDQRGALADDCWGDSAWNPRWYVALKNSPNGYAAEIAIHLHDLTGEPIPAGKAWAMNVVRIVPGKGVLSASAPADVAPRPEGCGLLLFADPAPN